MVIAVGDDERVGVRSASRRSSSRGDHLHLARASSSSSPPPPPSLEAEKEVFHSRRLHNFSFPPMSLSWRNQRILRCSKLPNAAVSGSNQPPPPAIAVGHSHHRSAASGKRPASSSSSPCRETSRAEDFPSTPAVAAVVVEAATEAAAAARPWNLRTRRAACNDPDEKGRNRCHVLVSGSPSRLATKKNDSPAIKSGKMPSEGLEKKRNRLEFSMTLTKEEIEEDYRLLKGTKPPRRPMKRPKSLQGLLDLFLPGFVLSEITPDAYEIDERRFR